MYFYVDESGQTGNNLFDDSQPHLYYGVVSSKHDLDIEAKEKIEYMRSVVGVERLHASEMGSDRLIQIIDDLVEIDKKFEINFIIHRITKLDHALISFFDQVFDQGLNKAVPWAAYWTPLRYILLFKVACLFDRKLLEMAWNARLTLNNSDAETILVAICKEVRARINRIPDSRSQEILSDALNWAIKKPESINYNINSKKDSLQISPNLIGFQAVMHSIASSLKKTSNEAKKIIVDQQSQFNKAQRWIANLYRNKNDVNFEMGPMMPIMDLRNIPNIPILCTPGNRSVGLEIVDMYLWIFKRIIENKDISQELEKLAKSQLYKFGVNEISLAALEERWGKFFNDMPEPTEEQLEKAYELINQQKDQRTNYIKNIL